MPPAHAFTSYRSGTESANLMESSNNKFRIRDARPDDCSSIYRMIYQLAVCAEMTDKVTITAEQLKADGFGDGHPPRFSALVIERMDESGTQPLDLVGYSIYTEKYSTWKGRMLWVEDIFIEEPYRKFGLGAALMRKFATIAVKLSLDRIEWCCLSHNHDAVGFYESVGAFDLTAAEDWMLYRFNADQYRQYLARPWKRSETIKIL